jgi:hypothetical protein
VPNHRAWSAAFQRQFSPKGFKGSDVGKEACAQAFMLSKPLPPGTTVGWELLLPRRKNNPQLWGSFQGGALDACSNGKRAFLYLGWHERGILPLMYMYEHESKTWSFLGAFQEALNKPNLQPTYGLWSNVFAARPLSRNKSTSF